MVIYISLLNISITINLKKKKKKRILLHVQSICDESSIYIITLKWRDYMNPKILMELK